jgi:GTP-binding protein
MKIIEAKYTGSFSEIDQLPSKALSEVAFAGRSNVGKSSLINFLCERKNLAHTSSQPGKTQTFNFYQINNGWNLVDLPGYGFAKVSQEKRLEWKTKMLDYFEKREQLKLICQLIDSRISPQKIDIEFAEALKMLGLRHIQIFTKADNKFKNITNSNIAAFHKAMKENKIHFPPKYFISSVSDKKGRIEILDEIQSNIF